MHRSHEEYSPQQRVLWRRFVKWAVCIITTNAAPPNAHPMRRRHRIECLQKISSFAWQCADAAIYVPHGTSPHLSIDEPTEMLPLLSRAFGFFVGTIEEAQGANHQHIGGRRYFLFFGQE